MFGSNSKDSYSKVDILESKLDIYEQLSREMVSKLEIAVEKISEGNARIASILIKHDEKIEQNIKSDELIVKMIDELKENTAKDHEQVSERINRIESSIDELFKFKWQIGGIGALIVIIVSVATSVVPNLPNLYNKFIDNQPQIHYNGDSHH